MSLMGSVDLGTVMIAGVVGILLLGVIGLLMVARALKKTKVGVWIAGVDPRSGPGLLGKFHPVDGAIDYRPKGAAQGKTLTLDTAYAVPTSQGPLYFFDLELGVPFRLERLPEDDPARKIDAKDPGKRVYQRLPPERLYNVRKDTRTKQMSAVYEDWRAAVAKWAIIGFGGLFLAILGLGMMFMMG